MTKSLIIKTVVSATIIILASAIFALATNALRADGIPVIATTPYDIFSECKDAVMTAPKVDQSRLESLGARSIYVDARPAEVYQKEHVAQAINVPYSALFGASEADIQKVRNATALHPEAVIIVYGLLTNADTSNTPVDFAGPLANQLAEAGLENVTHIEGGIETLKNSGVETVKEK